MLILHCMWLWHSFHIVLNHSGNNTGVVQIVNISSGMVEKEYSVHIGPVRYDIYHIVHII